jgi:hypothetical protein
MEYERRGKLFTSYSLGAMVEQVEELLKNERPMYQLKQHESGMFYLQNCSGQCRYLGGGSGYSLRNDGADMFLVDATGNSHLCKDILPLGDEHVSTAAPSSLVPAAGSQNLGVLTPANLSAAHVSASTCGSSQPPTPGRRCAV